MKKLMTKAIAVGICALCVAGIAAPKNAVNKLPTTLNSNVSAVSVAKAIKLAESNEVVRAKLDECIASNIVFFGDEKTNNTAKVVFVDGLGSVQLNPKQYKSIYCLIKPDTYPKSFAKALSDLQDDFLKGVYADQKTLLIQNVDYRRFAAQKMCNMYKYVCYDSSLLYVFKRTLLLKKISPKVLAYVKKNGVEFNGKTVKAPVSYTVTSTSEGGKTETKIFDPAAALLDEVAAELDSAYLGNVNALLKKYGVNATIDTSFLPRGEALVALKAKVAAGKESARKVLPCMSVDEYNTFVKSLKK